MTKDELKKNLKDAEDIYAIAKRKIYREYAFSNNHYKIGDIISDHIRTIRIEKINYSIRWEESECVYVGILLDKKGNPAKKQIENTIYQSNIKP